MYDNERDKEILQAPYKRIAKAEELVNSNALLDLYVTLYKKRYKDEPIFPVSREHLGMIKSFAQSTGHKAYGLLEHYFEMKEDWFYKQAHSIACLLNNVNKVNASYSQKVAAHKPLTTNLIIHTFCDSCWAFFIFTPSLMQDLDKPRRCSDCIKNNAPLKRVSKTEIKQTIAKLGGVFPEVPREHTEAEKEQKKTELLNEIRG